MSRTIGQVAARSAEIASTIADISVAAQGTASGVADTRTATRELSELSHQLHTLVAQFRV